MCTHNTDDNVESQVFQPPVWVSKPLLKMVQSPAMMQHDFLGRFPGAGHNRRICLDLRNGGLEHAYIADDKLEVFVG